MKSLQEYTEERHAEYEAELLTRGIEWGVCFCGCGSRTKVSRYTSRFHGHVRGLPRDWLVGHCNRNGRYRGERNPCAKLNESRVREIRRLLAEGDLTQEQIAAMFGVAGRTVCVIGSKKTWKHVV